MRSAALSLFLIFGVPVNGLAKDKEPMMYFQLDGGTAKFADSKLNGTNVDFNDGWSANARVGAEGGRGALELDIGVHGASYSPLNGNFSPAVFLTVGGTVLLKIIKTPVLDWYVGVGGGFIGFDNSASGQVEARAETGFIIKPTEHLHLVPHYRVIALFSNNPNSQYISTVRLGIRLANLGSR